MTQDEPWLVEWGPPDNDLTDNDYQECRVCKGAGYSTISSLCEALNVKCVDCGGWGAVKKNGKPKAEVKKKGKKSMNYSTAVMALNENIRAVKASYEPEIKDGNGKVIKSGQSYVFRTLDHSIKIGDLCVVPSNTRHNFTTVKIEEVDIEVDLESDTVLKWIVAKVDTAPYYTLLTEEAKWVEQLKKADKHAKKNEIKKKMLDMYQGVDISTMAIASMKDSSELLSITSGVKENPNKK